MRILFMVLMICSVSSANADSALNVDTLSQRSDNSFIQEAQIAYVSGDFEKALSNYALALKQDERIAGYYIHVYWMGRSLIMLGRSTEARDAFELLIHQNKFKSMQIYGYYGIAEAFYYDGAMKKAQKQYKDILNMNDAGTEDIRAQSLYRLGMIGEKEGDAKQAEDYFSRLRNEFPNSYAALSSGDYYYVQLGAFQNRDNAQRLFEQMQKKGYMGLMDTYISQDKRFYRVRIGPYRNQDTAQQSLKQIMQNEKLNATLMKERH
ncbi:MAG: SPOR domain-containing protein [Chlamydiota bacterium]|nr:SPOR domain-containing protein [Chlamydiota bacterium]